jgi:orotidine 5'-phosphate decarboxylase subfamily 2
MVLSFREKILESYRKKNSVLCVGLDPALPSQRKSNVIPSKYLDERNENKSRLNFCLSLVEATSKYCVAFKPNQQYVAGFTLEDHRKLTTAIRAAGCVSILDYKLNDIGDSIESAIFHIKRWGYNAITFNPFLGNIESTVNLAHSGDQKLGIIVLTLTSNPETVRYQKETKLNGKPIYLVVAEDARRYEADGCVVGATGHVTVDEIKAIRNAAGSDKIFLVPGVGTQKGDPQKVVESGGNVLINVSRDVDYSESPGEKAKEYTELFRSLGAKFT